ncbi:hypothetical protein LX36DRAFT_251962 [Colletotrichum falcatum]|nr:hypothetical protein LX36DRAFT_251962 [Colletotrichum falcatum]
MPASGLFFFFFIIFYFLICVSLLLLWRLERHYCRACRIRPGVALRVLGQRSNDGCGQGPKTVAEPAGWVGREGDDWRGSTREGRDHAGLGGGRRGVEGPEGPGWVTMIYLQPPSSSSSSSSSSLVSSVFSILGHFFLGRSPPRTKEAILQETEARGGSEGLGRIRHGVWARSRAVGQTDDAGGGLWDQPASGNKKKQKKRRERERERERL